MADQNEQVFLKMDNWVEILNEQILTLNLQRTIFKEVQDIIKANPLIEPSHFFYYLSNWYSTSMSIAVRRLTDNDKKSISYLRLLECIKNNPQAVSRSRYLSKHTSLQLSLARANQFFDTIAGVGNKYLDLSIIQVEIDELVTETSKLKVYVDKKIAHDDSSAPPPIPKFDDLDKAIDHLGTLHEKYFSIFRLETPSDISILYDWIAIFRRPWIPEPRRFSAIEKHD